MARPSSYRDRFSRSLQKDHVKIVIYIVLNPLSEASSNTTMFLQAIERGDLKATRQLLEGKNGIGVETKAGGDQLTPLHGACYFGKLQIARYLVHELKANVDAVECDGWTPLYQTCYYYVGDGEHSLELVELLLRNGANVNVKALRYGVGSTALHQACQNRGDTHLIQQ